MTINNRLVKTVKCCLALLTAALLAPCAKLAADEAKSPAKKSDMVAFSNQNLRGQDKKYQPVNSWTPYFTWIGNVQDQTKTTFTSATIGIGFLRGSKLQGNLGIDPQSTGGGYDFGIQFPRNALNRISYNRTPLYEWAYGYKIFSWMDIMLAVQNQNSVNVQTNMVNGNIVNNANSAWYTGTGDQFFYQYRGQLGLNSIMVKLNFELPWALVWKTWMHTARLGFGVGPGWQSWTDNRVYIQNYNGAATLNGRGTFVNTLRQKYSANCVFQVDAGVRMKPATPCADVSLLFGCKYNQWGKTNNIGKLEQQGDWKFGLLVPFQVQVIYSFAPYLGFQWNF